MIIFDGQITLLIKLDVIHRFAISNLTSTISMHIPSLVKSIDIYLSSGNENRTLGGR